MKARKLGWYIRDMETGYDYAYVPGEAGYDNALKLKSSYQCQGKKVRAVRETR